MGTVSDTILTKDEIAAGFSVEETEDYLLLLKDGDKYDFSLQPDGIKRKVQQAMKHEPDIMYNFQGYLIVNRLTEAQVKSFAQECFKRVEHLVDAEGDHSGYYAWMALMSLDEPDPYYAAKRVCYYARLARSMGALDEGRWQEKRLRFYLREQNHSTEKQ